MDSRAVQTHGHEYDEHQHHHPHNLGLQQGAHGTEEHHQDHEKKSVLKKVKAKAKKIKDTITKHGHHEHDNEYHYGDQHIPDDHDLDEEDDEDEEMVEGPEVHGAPIYGSAAVRSATPGQTDHLGKPGVNIGDAQVVGGVEPHHEPRLVVVSPTTGINQSRATDPARTFVGEEKGVHRQVNLERPMDLEEDPHAPGSRPQAHALGNYQTKVTDPTGAGGKEIDIAPVQRSLDRMTIHNEPKPNPKPQVTLPTITETHYPSISHTQFVPELSTPIKTHFPRAESHDQQQHLPPLSGEVKTNYPTSHDHFTPGLSSVPKTPYPYGEGYHQNLPELSHGTKTQYPSAATHDQFVPEYSSTETRTQNFPEQYSGTKSQYPSAAAGSGSHDHFVPQLSTQTKTHYPSAGTHDQFSPEPVPTSTNMYPEEDQTFNTTNIVAEKPQSMEKPANESSYTDKISSATSAITDKAISAKNAVASTLGYGEKGGREESQTRYNEENNISGEKPSNQGSYTEKISSATSAIADKAVSAKNTVASKLGYGDNKVTTTTHEEKTSENNPSSNMSESATEYGKKIAHSLTEKLTPVYGTVAGVGSAVKSKVPGTGTNNAGARIERENVVKEQDKGVSVKDYLVDKLRPGDEDRALSEVISETLHKRGPEETEDLHVEEENRDVKDVVWDAIHKRDEDQPKRSVPLGKVTESEEVKRRLGGGRNEKTEAMYEETIVQSPGKGVVDKLKGVVGSWFGKSEENQSSQGAGAEHLSKQHVAVDEQVPRAAG